MEEKKALKIILTTGLYVVYLMLIFVASGELTRHFAKEVMGTAAYTILAILFIKGTAIFYYVFKKILKEK